MTMRVKDIVEGSVPVGSEVELEGTITDILPSFSLGDIVYERFSLEDGTGRLTVILPTTPKYFLPDDRVRVRGRARPCPYAPSVTCLETSGDDIDILEWKWIEPRFREEAARKGAFNVNALLQITKFDRELIKGVVETGLDPLKIREKFEEDLSSGRDVRYLVDTIAAMTMYAVFLRDLPAADVVKTTLYLLSNLDLPDGERRVLKVLGEMIDALVSREGLAPYISPPEAIQGIVERYPVAEEDEIEGLPRLGSLAKRIIEDLKEGKKEFLIVEISDGSQVMEARKMAEVAAGVAKAKLYYMPISSLSSAEGMGQVISDLKSIVEGIKPDEKVVFYMEGIEILAPSERMMEMMKLDPQAVLAAMAFKADLMKTLESLLEKAVVVSVTSSKVLIDDELASKAAQVISGQTGMGISGKGSLPY